MFAPLFFNKENDKRPTRDLVVEALAKHPSLNLAELTRTLLRDFSVKLSYQAVRKVVNRLLEQEILTVDNKQYHINSAWLSEVKGLVDSAIVNSKENAASSNNSASAITSCMSSSRTFSSLYELDYEWGRVMAELAEALQREQNQRIICYYHYAWWMLINFGQETSLFNRLKRFRLPIYCYYTKQNPLNFWAAEVYSELGAECSFIRTESFPENVNFNFFGNTIIQIEYPEVLFSMMDDIFKSTESIHLVDHKLLQDLTHLPAEISFSVYRNGTVVKALDKLYQEEGNKQEA